MIYWVLLVLFLLCIFILVCDSNRFHTVEYTLHSEKAKGTYRFVFLSDLHGKVYGKDNEKLLKAIEKECPDAVLIGGDLLTARPNRSFDSSVKLLEQLLGRYPVYYANGNHEHRLELYPEVYGDMAERYENEMKRLGISRIRNSMVAEIAENIDLVGCEIDRMYYKRFRKIKMSVSYLQKLLPPRKEDHITILMAHNPAYFEAYSDWGADLVLSGHVHGGVAKFPLLGGVISPDLKLFPKYDGGLFRKGQSTMILSRGLGAHTIPFRFLNPGELIVITMKEK